ncbi:MAG: hypothetical protein LLG04_16155 [Parachlamydia sp.]|nr:hypothetical protein [Parachlamydia sp.]
MMNAASLNPNFLVNNPDECVLHLPAGKPDPTFPCESLERDLRRRVKQSAQGNSVCWLAALKLVGPRIGKYPSKELLAKREIERTVSAFNKQFKFVRELLNLPGAVAQSPDFKDKQSIPNFIHSLEILSSIQNGEIQRISRFLIEGLKMFQGQTAYTDLGQFLHAQFIQNSIENCKTFLKHFNIDSPTLYEEYFRVKTLPQPLWKDLKTQGRKNAMENQVFRIAFQNLGFVESPWKPSDPIEVLMKEIKTHGPLVVCGNLGQPYHREPAFQLSQKLNGRSVWGWKPQKGQGPTQAVTTAYGREGHAVVIIGARAVKGHEGYVLFIDPRDGSDPADPEQQRIYIMSLDRLRRGICSLWQEHMWDNDLNPIFSDTCNYALYHPLQAAKLQEDHRK